MLAYNSRGVVHYDMKNYDLAIADYEAALRIDPNYKNARDYLELARRQKGR